MMVLTSSAQTKGLNTVLRVEVPPGVGPPAHIHMKEDETYVITRGHFRFWLSTQTIEATPGSVVFLPRNQPHQFLNVGNTTGEQILIITPSGFEHFFEEIGKRGLAMPKDTIEVMRLSAA